MKSAFDPNRGPDTHHDPTEGLLVTAVKRLKEKTSDNSGVVIWGYSASAVIGAGTTAAVGKGFDLQGNYGYVLSGGFCEGIPSAGAAMCLTVSTAPNLAALEGTSFQAGGSWCETLMAGFEVSTSTTADNGTYKGYNLFVGTGVGPTAMEVHCSATDSSVHWRGNIWDDLIIMLGGSIS